MPLRRLPLRTRLVVGFAAAMVVVLIAAGAFVFWRVQYALDSRLDQDLRNQTDDLRDAAALKLPARAVASLRGEARDAQVLTAEGRVLASGTGVAGGSPLLTPTEARQASGAELNISRGGLFSGRGEHLRILAVPVSGKPGSPAAIAATAVRLDQRDEALRELLAQLAVANLLALALASAVSYRLARAALDPVERYREHAEEIAAGATGVRLAIPTGPEDEISRLGETLNSMLDAQEDAAERQRQFIDDASHELRTPLTTLSVEVDLALRKPRTVAQLEEALRRIAAELADLDELADRLLTLGAIEGAPLVRGGVSAHELVERAAQRARGQLSINREVKVEAAQGLKVCGDEALLDRALGNLVDNACRHGDGVITLTAERIEGLLTPATRLTVHDEGEGIAPEFLPHAMERFRQDDASRTGPGAGLGLSLVDAILTAHRGQLRLCSADRHHRQATVEAALNEAECQHPERGTTLSLLLPDLL